MAKGNKSNNSRSDSMNPNNSAQKASVQNRAKQLDPNQSS